ncbi:hypothetical protein LX36DRAFT_118590 [Colletotrichum falcatum]|nr:hypothetical protein LX36DRAFT_118590 [Colletotrichum falcatum]
MDGWWCSFAVWENCKWLGFGVHRQGTSLRLTGDDGDGVGVVWVLEAGGWEGDTAAALSQPPKKRPTPVAPRRQEPAPKGDDDGTKGRGRLTQFLFLFGAPSTTWKYGTDRGFQCFDQSWCRRFILSLYPRPRSISRPACIYQVPTCLPTYPAT